MTAAAERARKDRRRFYALAEDDPDFAELWQQAEQAGIDVLEDELRRAASEGWLEVEETMENGEVVRRVERHRKDPRLLTRLREWRRPAIDVHANLHVHPNAGEIEGFTPATLGDVMQLARDLGVTHLFELPEVVDAEITELPVGDEEASDGT